MPVPNITTKSTKSTKSTYATNLTNSTNATNARSGNATNYFCDCGECEGQTLCHHITTEYQLLVYTPRSVPTCPTPLILPYPILSQSHLRRRAAALPFEGHL